MVLVAPDVCFRLTNSHTVGWEKKNNKKKTTTHVKHLSGVQSVVNPFKLQHVPFVHLLFLTFSPLCLLLIHTRKKKKNQGSAQNRKRCACFSIRSHSEHCCHTFGVICNIYWTYHTGGGGGGREGGGGVCWSNSAPAPKQPPPSAFVIWYTPLVMNTSQKW